MIDLGCFAPPAARCADDDGRRTLVDFGRDVGKPGASSESEDGRPLRYSVSFPASESIPLIPFYDNELVGEVVQNPRLHPWYGRFEPLRTMNSI
jgi:hypothetical protein